MLPNYYFSQLISINLKNGIQALKVKIKGTCLDERLLYRANLELTNISIESMMYFVFIKKNLC